MVGCRIQKKLRFEKDLIIIYDCKIVAFIFIDINLKNNKFIDIKKINKIQKFDQI